MHIVCVFEWMPLLRSRRAAEVLLLEFPVGLHRYGIPSSCRSFLGFGEITRLKKTEASLVFHKAEARITRVLHSVHTQPGSRL